MAHAKIVAVLQKYNIQLLTRMDFELELDRLEKFERRGCYLWSREAPRAVG